MIGIAWSFLTSKVGRYLALAGATLILIAGALLRAFGAGKASERANEQKAQINAVQDAHKIHQDVGGLPPDAVDRELRQWGR